MTWLPEKISWVKNFVLKHTIANSAKSINKDWVKQSKAFCMLPWLHLHVTQKGTVTPCCQTPWGEEYSYGNINKQTIEEIWNGRAIRMMRLDMLKDKPDTRCERCYKKENAGIFSLRNATNMMYEHHLNRVKQTKHGGFAIDSPPVYFDIRFSNFCNFKCRICGPESSSSWYNEAKEMGYVLGDNRATQAINNETSFFNSLKKYLPLAEEIYFAGGEPTLMPQHYKMLDLLLECRNTDVLLRYSTNFSNFDYKGKSVFDYWKKFKRVNIYASLDDSGARGEFQRKGQKWNEVIENRRHLSKECPHVKFSISPTVSILNVLHLPAFHRELTETGFIEVGDLIPSVLEEPYYYNIRALPPSKKQEVKNEIEKHVEWMKIQATSNIKLRDFVIAEYAHLINFMYSEDLENHIHEFKNISAKLDKIRGETTKEVIPELSDL